MSKRIFDCLAAALGLLVLGPLLLGLAILIRLDDGGPALFAQMRIGRGRRAFRIYKFRSMRDGEITRVGAWLRSTGLDELPQLVNLLRGDMSLIGPRPLTLADVQRLGWDDERHALRWQVRPGIAGLAQIYAGSGARLSWFLDCRYVRERSLRMEAGIAFVAAAMCVLGKRRVRNRLRRRRAPARIPLVTGTSLEQTRRCGVAGEALRTWRTRARMRTGELAAVVGEVSISGKVSYGLPLGDAKSGYGRQAAAMLRKEH
ncbi:MAG TPA: sugar transferase [Gammaproteobacteria bacterium]|nr:sugar transferase [Gammaproteobacteria bacterium]